MLTRVANVSHEYGLEISIGETKWMVIHKKYGRDPLADRKLKLYNKLIEVVAKFQYLETCLYKETGQSIEIC